MLTRSQLGYKAAFYLHALLSVPTLFILLRFQPQKQTKEPPQFSEGLKVLMADPDALLFFALVFAIGVSSGVIENFAYKRLRELGGGGGVMGVSRLISSFAGIPMFWFSGSLTKRITIAPILMMALVCMAKPQPMPACLTD